MSNEMYAAPTPSSFYVMDNESHDIKKSFFAHQLFNRPTYALVGQNRDVKARIVSLMFPKELEVNEPTDTWVVALTGSNVNAPPSKYLSQVVVTNNYTIVEASSIPESSIWDVSEPTYMPYHIPRLKTSPSLPRKYNAYNVLPAELDAVHNSDGTKLIVSHLLLPTEIRERDVGAYQHLYVIGYRPGRDSVFSLQNELQPLLIDESLLSLSL